ncbi:MAG: cytochrome c oxidase assembly factor Coa1 family protein [Terracidiphilus sp.]|jgi:hypothetical protein
MREAYIIAGNMNPKRNRPIGVTLIALVFLWIGCCGTLFLPIIGLAGGLSSLWRLALGSTIHSEAWLNTISYLLDSVWFLLYVVYAVIGFGLWKLRNWARKSVLGISIVGIIAGLVVSLVFVRPIIFGIGVIGIAAVQFGWLSWYLMRPRVRYAFGVWNRYSPTGEWIEPPGLSKLGKLGIGTLVAASFVVLFVIPLFFAIDADMRNSDAYKLTMNTAQESPCVTSVLGSPIKPGWMMTGGLQESSIEGSANLSIPVIGPKGKGNLDVQATELNGNWRINSLVFTHGAVHSNIVPSESNQTCQ